MLVTSIRKTTPFRWVALGFLVLLAIGLALAVVVHERYVAYDPVAAHHLDSEAAALVRFDLTHVMFYEPFRRSLAPLADRVPARPVSRLARPQDGEAGRTGAGRVQRLEARGVHVAGDIREIGLALGPDPGGWTLVFGGRLQKTGLDRTLADVFREEGRTLVSEGGVFEARDPEFAFAQAADGALVLASSVNRLRSALSVQTAPAELSQGAGGFLLRAPLLSEGLYSIRGSFRTGSVVAVEADVAFQPRTPEAIRNQALTAALGALGGADPDVRAALDRTERRAAGSAEHLSIRLPREAVLGLARRAAAVILAD